MRSPPRVNILLAVADWVVPSPWNWRRISSKGPNDCDSVWSWIQIWFSFNGPGRLFFNQIKPYEEFLKFGDFFLKVLFLLICLFLNPERKVPHWISSHFLEARNLNCFLPSWHWLIRITQSRLRCHCRIAGCFHKAVQGEFSAGEIQLVLQFAYSTLAAGFIPRLY